MCVIFPVSEDEVVSPSLSSSDPKTVDRMLDRPYAKEWKRLGIASFPRNNGTGIGNMLNKGEAMRFSFANTNYSICSTYPALLVVPHGVSDEALKKVAAGYNMGRFPILTWRHATTKALLLRGAAMNSRGIGARVFRGPNHPGKHEIILISCFLMIHYIPFVRWWDGWNSRGAGKLFAWDFESNAIKSR